MLFTYFLNDFEMVSVAPIIIIIIIIIVIIIILPEASIRLYLYYPGGQIW
jgi:hypothetical protein